MFLESWPAYRQKEKQAWLIYGFRALMQCLLITDLQQPSLKTTFNNLKPPSQGKKKKTAAMPSKLYSEKNMCMPVTEQRGAIGALKE